MKAKVKKTGDIVEATIIHVDNGKLWYEIDKSGYCLTDEELDFHFEREPDYWEKLKHQYAGMAMQGILSNPESELDYKGDETLPQALAGCAAKVATALVEKLKKSDV